MQLYSITSGEQRPWLAFTDFDTRSSYSIPIMISAEGAGQAFLLRACHEGFSAMSALWGLLGDDGTMELFLFARAGQTRRTVSDPMHHHVSELTKDAKAYADAVGARRFIIRVANRTPDFLSRRFPDWEAIDVDGLGYAVLEFD